MRSGTLRLSLPPRASLDRAIAWARTQEGWVEAQSRRMPPALPLADGVAIPFCDGTLTLRHDPSRKRGVLRKGDVLHIGGAPDRLAAATLRWLRAEALRLLSAETAEFAARAGVRVTRVSVGDPKSRWGSCAASGAIRYSWRLILTPAHVRRATVAHEVAHRVHMDHSPRFHALVAEIADGDPKAARAWLARHGAAIQGIGVGAGS
ncbi:M48 family peptidase [Sphingomonas gilva]|uniref:M48 family peptidase n=2 Tax=Sphingomonas gilva TaxID=2305907 RepID=A0A396RN20_9SPHN|nr:SprT family zinc-dependent metalloprotease [Sphingomonas gilva]RHW17788.1 M48 family peptidase [Sphingomonas gilva]